MSVGIARLCLVALAFASSTAVVSAQSTADEYAAGATGQHNGAIHSLGAAGFNSRSSDKDPPIVIPPLNEGPSGTSGVPLGTTVGRRIR